MIDAEVMRLRRLRNTVLRARAMARMLDSHSGRLNSVFSRSAIDCWRVARVITGKLRAHPYLPYQQGPGDLRRFTITSQRSCRADLPNDEAGNAVRLPWNCTGFRVNWTMFAP